LALFARFGRIAKVSVAAGLSWDASVLALFLLYRTKRARMGRAFRAIVAVWSGLGCSDQARFRFLPSLQDDSWCQAMRRLLSASVSKQ
jgi:hypothetical protein